MAKKRKRKKVRLKSSFKRFLVYATFFIIVAIYATTEGIKIYKDYQYQKTDEYKITQNGYELEQAKKMLEILNQDQINFIIENEYNENYYEIITQKYFLSKNFEKYIEYKENHEDTPYDKIIALVNVHANSGWYNAEYNTDTSKNELILVNKFYHLNSDFKRDDIKNIDLSYSYANNSASSLVIESFIDMYNDVLENLGVKLLVNSSYRSYQDQEEIYNEFRKISQKYADSYAARPGYSEHQTGLAIDITSNKHPGSNTFKESEEYKWLKDNSYKYGFILRYPEGKEDITGYSNESWHFRYVGVDVAKQIYEENLTFDEYYAYYIEGNDIIEQINPEE